ncbi:MAG TPA: ribonuclease HI [Chitinophagales bacterium]|jgi:ribonuclease HI|nr:ribonuclease HI [Chitinophagales bacterium]
MVQMYTDGSAKGNPGPGGFGTILRYGRHEKELSGGFRRTTNNRMELMAVIAGLEAMTKEGLDITIYTDSKYVCEAIEKRWIYGWMQKSFAGKKNADLWMRLMRSYARHKVKFIWIKGHAGHPENERCDALAQATADLPNLPPDTGYENQQQSGLGLD